MPPDAPATPPFFVLEHEVWMPHDTQYSTVDCNLGPAETCPQCGDFIGKLTWLPPYRVKMTLYGQDFGDHVAGFGADMLITERFADAFRAERLSGLTGFHPVEVVKVQRKRKGSKRGEAPKYLFVVPVLGQAAVDDAHSHIWRTSTMKCTWCRETGVDAISGFTLEPGTWGGEDIFMPRGLLGSILVSERFARFVQAHALTNMKLTPIEQYVWDPLGRYPPQPATDSRS